MGEPGSRPIRRRACALGALLLTVSLLTAQGAEADRLQRRLERLQRAMAPVLTQYPQGFTAELRVPEFVANLPPDGRDAWGKGYIALRLEGGAYQMHAENLREPNATGVVDAGLKLWQAGYSAEMQVLALHMPDGMVALVLPHAAAFDYSEEERDRHLRFGGTATAADSPLRELACIVDEYWALKVLRVVYRDGTEVRVTYESERESSLKSPWLVRKMHAVLVPARGPERRIDLALSYRNVTHDGQTYRMLRDLRREVRDAQGDLVKTREKDLNPVTYSYSDYRITDGRRAAAAQQAQPPVGDLWDLVK